MARKSVLEEILENSFKYPIIGGIISLLAAIGGFYFSHQSAPAGTAASITNGMNLLFGKVLYWLAGIILIISALGYTAQVINRKKKHAFFDQQDSLADLKALPWKEFEYFVGTFFEKMGYKVEVTGGLKDGGIDVIISKDNKLHFVQCKKYREKQVTLSMVRDFYGAMAAKRNREKGFFVTTGPATLDAQKFAEENSIELIDGPKLLEYMKMSKLGTVQKTAIHATPPETAKTNVCPACGAPMVVRVAKKGAHANEPFWGCTNYPKCKAIVKYEK